MEAAQGVARLDRARAPRLRPRGGGDLGEHRARRRRIRPVRPCAELPVSGQVAYGDGQTPDGSEEPVGRTTATARSRTGTPARAGTTAPARPHRRRLGLTLPPGPSRRGPGLTSRETRARARACTSGPDPPPARLQPNAEKRTRVSRTCQMCADSRARARPRRASAQALGADRAVREPAHDDVRLEQRVDEAVAEAPRRAALLEHGPALGARELVEVLRERGGRVLLARDPGEPLAHVGGREEAVLVLGGERRGEQHLRVEAAPRRSRSRAGTRP